MAFKTQRQRQRRENLRFVAACDAGDVEDAHHLLHSIILPQHTHVDRLSRVPVHVALLNAVRRGDRKCVEFILDEPKLFLHRISGRARQRVLEHTLYRAWSGLWGTPRSRRLIVPLLTLMPADARERKVRYMLGRAVRTAARALLDHRESRYWRTRGVAQLEEVVTAAFEFGLNTGAALAPLHAMGQPACMTAMLRRWTVVHERQTSWQRRSPLLLLCLARNAGRAVHASATRSSPTEGAQAKTWPQQRARQTR